LVGKEDVGVIAQDISGIWDFAIKDQSMVPSASGEATPYMKVNYSKFIPLLINAVQELSSEIERLKKKN
jgi:hypothetical protein